MKTLVVGQNSKLSQMIHDSRSQEQGYAVWNDTDELVVYPVSLEESARRKSRWIQGQVTWTKTFEEICLLFPDFVWNLPMGTKADWGMGLYIENADGYPALMDSNWDTSD